MTNIQRPAVAINRTTIAPIDWVLTEPVDITLVKLDNGSSDTSECETIVLVTRTRQPGAVTLSFCANGDILVNGVYHDLGEDMMEYCAMTDELTMAPSPVIGSTVHNEPSLREHVKEFHPRIVLRGQPDSTVASKHAEEHWRMGSFSHHHGPNAGAHARPRGWRDGSGVVPINCLTASYASRGMYVPAFLR